MEIIYHPEARQEMLEAAAFYESNRKGLGRKFLSAAKATENIISIYPEAGRIMLISFRRFLIKRFPYGIIYRETDYIIYIVAIMHLKRRPGYWLERIKSS
jgi:hypothetical protein